MLRRVCLLLLLLVGAVFPAHAQLNQNHATQSEALSHCLADKATTQAYWSATGFPGVFGANTCSAATVPQGQYTCTASQTNLFGLGNCVHSYSGSKQTGWVRVEHTGYSWSATGCTPPEVFDTATQSCIDPRCPSMPVVPTNPVNEGRTWCQTSTGSNGQSYSCEVLGLRQLPTQPFAGYVAGNPTGDKCDPNNYECPAGYRKQADGTCQPVPECPDGVPIDGGTGDCTQPAECPTGKKKDANGECVPEKEICPVGQVKGPDGSCVKSEDQCGAGQAEGKDGACKPDSDDDGTPDDEEEGAEPDGEHKAEDSPTCDRPPLCSGDEIMCLHAKQLWRIDCNTRKARNVIMGEYCQQMPVCESVALGDEARNVGCDAVEEAALIQQWRTACATSQMVELMKKGGTSGGDAGTHSRLDAIKAFLDGNGQQLGQPQVPLIEAPIQSQEWSSGLGGSGTCPAPISTTVTIGGYSAPVNFSFEPLCQLANYLYAVVVTMGGLMAAFIIAGVRK